MDDFTIPDVESEDYDLERKKLARRRKLAEELIGTKAPGLIKAGDVYAMSAPDIGGALSRGLGKYEQNLTDQLETRLSRNERADQMKTLTSIPALGDANREQAQYNAAIKMPGLRSMIEHQMGSDARSQERDAERAWRGEQAEANRVESGEQKAADRVAREDLRAMPTVQIYQKDGSTNAAASANASNAAQQYAGAATQVGVDRDGNPVYRLTKTGKLYGFDENGQPREHSGIIAPKPTAASEKASAPANDIAASNTLLNQAEPLIPKATGSGVGNAVDMGLALIGQSTTGGDNAAKLKSIQGALISKMPKMSGPQSDKDVQLYREMAGRIGDPNVPRSQKQAALETVREINARYTGLHNAKPNAVPAANDDPLSIRGRK